MGLEEGVVDEVGSLGAGVEHPHVEYQFEKVVAGDEEQY